MESKAKLLGHPVHPMLIVFPLGLLATAVIFDIIHLASGNAPWSMTAYWMIPAGIFGGLLAAVFGLVDWLAIPAGTRAKRIGLIHGLGWLGGELVDRLGVGVDDGAHLDAPSSLSGRRAHAPRSGAWRPVRSATLATRPPNSEWGYPGEIRNAPLMRVRDASSSRQRP